MTADEFAEILDRLEWSDTLLARVVGVNRRTVRRWARGDVPVPDDVEEILRLHLNRRIAPRN